MSIQELENEAKRLPEYDRRKLLVDMFCDCCTAIIEDAHFKEECVRALETRGVDFREFLAACG